MGAHGVGAVVPRLAGRRIVAAYDFVGVDRIAPEPRVEAEGHEAGDRALRAGIELAQSLVHEVRHRYAGAYLMPSFGRYEQAAELARRLRARHPVRTPA